MKELEIKKLMPPWEMEVWVDWQPVSSILLLPSIILHGAMESDTIMVSSDKSLKMVTKFKFQTFGSAREILGKLKELTFNIKLDFMVKPEKLSILWEERKLFGKNAKQSLLEPMTLLFQVMQLLTPLGFDCGNLYLLMSLILFPSIQESTKKLWKLDKGQNT